ncbi:lipoprotein [Thermodesulfomicrobium sp. WS]|uniref:DUF4881 domain-containing protein n=1 Tax=Thermodesulfomicrobium sp. WS TaxID=3004129 RepID=UPI0024925743|nr:DUF4881 domain-containing protein [Thermodesulfomicrobium sp. WS]BDV01819.1 lipoprotein [Thermodesulfomicrobium sp. WS]
MKILHRTAFFVVAASLFLVTGCLEEGKVEQGRTVAYDKAKGEVTIIRDTSAVQGKPDYTHLPPVTFKIPADPAEMGPEPRPGGRMKLDMEKNEVVIFDAAIQNFVHIPFKLVDKQTEITKDHPLVAGKKFPIVDAAKRTVTIYSSRQKTLVTIEVAEADIQRPQTVWQAGDEIRVYYKQPGQALRLMNITQTDIYKK